MRIVHKSNLKKFSGDDTTFAAVSRMVQLANRHFGAKIVFDMKKTRQSSGDLSSVFAALGYNLQKADNALRILPRKACGVDVSLKKDMFGYYTDWSHELEKTFQSGGTKVFAFDPFDTYSFNDYLLHEAFRKDWKRILPYHYKLDVKDHLRRLFLNSSHHGNSKSPIFVGSSFDSKMLRFTLIDCGVGFFNAIRPAAAYVHSEDRALQLALDGFQVKSGQCGVNSLRALGDYCAANDGDLMIVSGCAVVRFCSNGTHGVSILPGAFRGSIVSFSVGIKLPEFLAAAA